MWTSKLAIAAGCSQSTIVRSPTICTRNRTVLDVIRGIPWKSPLFHSGVSDHHFCEEDLAQAPIPWFEWRWMSSRSPVVPCRLASVWLWISRKCALTPFGAARPALLFRCLPTGPLRVVNPLSVRDVHLARWKFSGVPVYVDAWVRARVYACVWSIPGL